MIRGICDFCGERSIGSTRLDERWTFRNCGELECRIKQKTIIDILLGITAKTRSVGK